MCSEDGLYFLGLVADTSPFNIPGQLRAMLSPRWMHALSIFDYGLGGIGEGGLGTGGGSFAFPRQINLCKETRLDRMEFNGTQMVRRHELLFRIVIERR